MIGNRQTNRTEKPNKTKRHPASFNPDPRWPGGYFQVLEELNIPKTRQPFYVHWVRLFFKRFLKRRRRDLGRAELTAFLNLLRKDPGIADCLLMSRHIFYDIVPPRLLESGQDIRTVPELLGL